MLPQAIPHPPVPQVTKTEPHKPRGSVGISKKSDFLGGGIVPWLRNTRTHSANATQIHKTTIDLIKLSQAKGKPRAQQQPSTSLEPRSAREGSAGDIYICGVASVRCAVPCSALPTRKAGIGRGLYPSSECAWMRATFAVDTLKSSENGVHFWAYTLILLSEQLLALHAAAAATASTAAAAATLTTPTHGPWCRPRGLGSLEPCASGSLSLICRPS